MFDKQKKFADAEAAFRQVLARDPDNAPALNYLGYMLADRGERLDESVTLIKKALDVDPDNGSYLDSLGWAYYKGAKLDLAEMNLKRAADQLRTNSVIQDHYGDVLVKLGRYDEAVAAWTRALAGDGDSILRADVDKKIRSAKQKTVRSRLSEAGPWPLALAAVLCVSCAPALAPLAKLPSGGGVPVGGARGR